MPVTALECARRAFLLALVAPLLADTHQEMVDFLTELADALSQGNAAGFLDRIDHSAPDYYKLEQYIDALTSADEVTSSIDITRQEGDEQHQSLDVDWFLEIHPQSLTGDLERRRQTVKIRLERRKKKKWKIVAIDPITLFAPPAVR